MALLVSGLLTAIILAFLVGVCVQLLRLEKKVLDLSRTVEAAVKRLYQER